MPIIWSKNSSGELSLRASPLRDAWEARGRGMLLSLKRNVLGGLDTENWPSVVVTIVPRLPSGGAGGEIDPAKGIVYINAVLANPLPQLPEVVRLAWMVAHVAIETAPSQRATHALALVPAILESAADVELARCDRPTISLALDAWNVDHGLPVDGEHLAEVVWQWWSDTSAGAQQSDASPRPWAQRVAELAAILTGEADYSAAEDGEDS